MNTKIKYNCDTCLHANICKYKDSTPKLDQLKLEILTPFSIAVECLYYQSLAISTNRLDITYNDTIPLSTNFNIK